MSRWAPNARGRLEQAALDLFQQRGFEHTTVDDIATRAGTTARTFFRYFKDKREVLFGGGDQFRQLWVDSLAAVPASATSGEAIGLTLDAVGSAFRDRRDTVRQRQAVIDANSELQERELVKLDAVATAVAATLRERGVVEPEASITADMGVAVFRNAIERWVVADDDVDLNDLVHQSLSALRSVIGSSGVTADRRTGPDRQHRSRGRQRVEE